MRALVLEDTRRVVWQETAEPQRRQEREAIVPHAEAMLVALPEGVDAAVVPSAADNMADGWRAVAPALAELPGADVLVVSGGGGRSIPLYAVDSALALGAASVTYVDTDAD